MARNPHCTKSCVCVMGNCKPRSWTKGEKYSPVMSQIAVRFLTSLAIHNGTALKQGDFKNAFAQANLPDDEQVALYPPPVCPFSHPGTYWVLKKSLYGLFMAARHWFDFVVMCSNPLVLLHAQMKHVPFMALSFQITHQSMLVYLLMTSYIFQRILWLSSILNKPSSRIWRSNLWVRLIGI